MSVAICRRFLVRVVPKRHHLTSGTLEQGHNAMRHLRFLGYVDEVARAGSIRKAADHLNVTASAVNRRIMDLEQELDAKLFERSRAAFG